MALQSLQAMAAGRDMWDGLPPQDRLAHVPDELPLEDERLDLECSATVNDEILTRSRTVEQHWSWPQIVDHAARNTRLRPGDVLGSGTLNRGCLLELGPLDGDRWLQPGDVVALDGGPLGRLENPVVG